MLAESSDPVTESTIIDMLRYSLEHAEKNLPHKKKVCSLFRHQVHSFCFNLAYGCQICFLLNSHPYNVSTDVSKLMQ